MRVKYRIVFNIGCGKRFKNILLKMVSGKRFLKVIKRGNWKIKDWREKCDDGMNVKVVLYMERECYVNMG